MRKKGAGDKKEQCRLIGNPILRIFKMANYKKKMLLAKVLRFELRR